MLSSFPKFNLSCILSKLQCAHSFCHVRFKWTDINKHASLCIICTESRKKKQKHVDYSTEVYHRYLWISTNTWLKNVCQFWIAVRDVQSIISYRSKHLCYIILLNMNTHYTIVSAILTNNTWQRIRINEYTLSAHGKLTWPRADRDLLIAAASTNRIPVASLRDILSEPARSTRVNLPLLVAFDTVS